MASSTSSKIDVISAKEIIDDLAAAANQFDAGVPLCSDYGIFKALSDAGFVTSSCSSYDSSVSLLKETLLNASVSLRAYIEQVDETDKKIEEEIPKEEEIIPEEEEEPEIKPENNVDDLNGNTEAPEEGTNTDGTSGELTETIPITEPPLKDPKKPSRENFEQIVEEVEKYYQNISSESLQSIVSDLYEEAMKRNITLQDLLSNDKYASVVLQIINKSKISSDILTKMNKIGIEKTRKIILNSLTGENNVLGLTKDSKEWVSESLKSLSSGTIKDLIKNKDPKVRDIVSQLKKITKEYKYDVGTRLTSIMLGLDDTKLAYMISTLFV